MHPTVPLRIKPERGGKIIINKLTTPTIKPRLARFIFCRIACVFKYKNTTLETLSGRG